MLFVFTESPYRTQHLLELLEASLVAAVFDQPVKVLIVGDAVWSLLPDQDGALIGRRTLGKMLNALPQYDIEQLYVCRTSLERRGLKAETLGVAATPLGLGEQQTLIAQSSTVFT